MDPSLIFHIPPMIVSNAKKITDSLSVELDMHSLDPHFSRAPPLDRRDSFFICEKLIFGKKSWSRHLFYFYFKGKIKQERKTLKCDSIIFGKACL